MPPILHVGEQAELDLSAYLKTGLRVGIWAASGRGKSYGVGVFAEEFLKAGLPLLAIDPEGELHTLREQFRVVVLGGPWGDLPLPGDTTGIRHALQMAVEEGFGLVVDLSGEVTSRAQQQQARPWLETLWALQSERHAPVAVIIEEVHTFAPQTATASTAEVMHRLAKQGRKRGIILVVASQRTQAVAKEFMSQLNFPAIGGFEVELDYQAVRAQVGRHEFAVFQGLDPGRFYLSATGTFIRWRPRLTAHGGDAPGWDDGTVTETHAAVPSEAVKRLSELFRQSEQKMQRDQSELAQAHRRIKELESSLQKTNQEIYELKLALRVVGSLRLSLSPLEAAVSVAQGASTPGAAPGPAQAPPPAADPPPQPAAPPVRPAPPPDPEPSVILAHPAFKSMVRRAQDRARRRVGTRLRHTGSYVSDAARLLAHGRNLTPAVMAQRYGKSDPRTIRRMEIVLSILVAVGLAKTSGTSYILHRETIREMIVGSLIAAHVGGST